MPIFLNNKPRKWQKKKKTRKSELNYNYCEIKCFLNYLIFFKSFSTFSFFYENKSEFLKKVKGKQKLILRKKVEYF